MLAVFPPKTIIFPSVDVAVGVKGWNEYPVIIFKELGHRRGFTISCDEGIGDIVDRRCADPFTSMRAPSNDDSLAGRCWLFRVGWVNTNAKCRYVSTFVRYADIDHADVGWEKRAHEAHPRDYDRKRLVVAEEDVGLIGRRAEVRTE